MSPGKPCPKVAGIGDTTSRRCAGGPNFETMNSSAEPTDCASASSRLTGGGGGNCIAGTVTARRLAEIGGGVDGGGGAGTAESPRLRFAYTSTSYGPLVPRVCS